MKNLSLIVCVAGAGLSFGQSKAGDVNVSIAGTVQDPKELIATGQKGKAGESKPLILVEGMPIESVDINAYLAQNIKYPEDARRKRVQGRVVVQFTVSATGQISDVKILRGIGGGCDEEVLRVVRQMARWKPGKKDGNPVSVYYTLPISFKLD